MRGGATPAARLAAVEQKLDSVLEQAEARLAALVTEAGSAHLARELRDTLARLLPGLRERIRGLAAMRHVFDAPGGLDPFGMDPSLIERAAPVLDFLYSAFWRVEVRSPGHVPASGPAVVAANHGGALPWDALVLRLAALREAPGRRELRPLLDARECALPIVGAAAVRLGAVAASPENAEKLLAQGKLVGVFPEGRSAAAKPWRERYRLQRFGRGGFVKLALRTGAPIVPCAIVGSEESTPAVSRAGWLADRLRLPFLGLAPGLPLGPLALLPLPARWSIRFDEPIITSQIGPAAADDPRTVNALTETVRERIQAMLDEDLAGRSSVYL